MESKKIKILAIDDNKDNLISLKALIKEAFADVTILIALSGEKGLELAVAEDPDVILLDIVMPGMDGFDVCRKLKADKKLSDIPLVFVTALKGDKESRIRALECGAEAFLSKPIDESELTAQIRAMVKIKTAANEKHYEKERLAALVEEQTHELKVTHRATLNLLEELRRENDARKKSEETLRVSEDRFKVITSSTPDHILVLDNELRYTLIINPQLGLTEQDMLGKTDYDFLSKKEADKLTGVKRQVIEAGEPMHLEMSLISKDGKPEFFDGTYIPKLDVNGKADGLIGYFRNVTERKLAEDALRESEERYRRLVEGSPDAIAVHSKGKFVFVNSAGVKLIGAKSPQELIGSPILDVVHPDSRSKVVDRMRQVAEGKEAPLFEEKFVKFDGSVIDVEVVGIPYSYRGQIATQVLVRDITDRKKIEEALKINEALFRELYDNMKSGSVIFTVINDGSKGSDYIIKNFNRIGLKMEGKALEEVVGKRFIDIRPTIDSYGLIPVMKKVWETGESAILPTRIYIDERYSNYYENYVFKLHSGEVVTLYDDVTESKNVEEMLRQTKIHLEIRVQERTTELERANHALQTQIAERKRAEEALQKAHNKLEQRVEERTEELRRANEKLRTDINRRKQAEEEIKNMKESLEKLNQHLDEIRENERAIISREIHDQLGQSLTALKIDLNWLLRQIDGDSEKSAKVEGMIELVTTTIRDVQRISFELRPAILDDLGLAAAVEWYCEEFANRTGLKVNMEMDDVQTESISKNLAIYRVLQESLTNIIRHAGAKKVQIKLRKIKKDIILIIHDDGIGISPDKIRSSKSLGLMGMFERVKQSGGKMEITTPVKGGTNVRIYIPIK